MKPLSELEVILENQLKQHFQTNFWSFSVAIQTQFEDRKDILQSIFESVYFSYSNITLEISNNKIINKPATQPHLPPEDRVSEQKFKENINEKIKNPVVPLKTIYENQV